MTRSILHRTWRAPRALTVLIACTVGCGDIRGDARVPVVRDSAGIRIVENSAPAWNDSEQWLIGDRPLLSIGAADGPSEYQFHLIVGAHRMSDGTIVVANRGTNDIRYFTPEGDLLRRLGGTGAGPGEFNLLYRSYLLHDTLFAYDAGLRRMTAFDADGQLVRTFGVVPLFNSPFVEPIGRLANGPWLAKEPQFMGDLEGLVRVSDHYFLLDEQGKATQLIDLWGEERILQGVGAGGGAYVRSAPFARRPSVGMLDDGFLYASAESYQFVDFAGDGRPGRIIRREHTPQAVGEEDVEAWQTEYEDNRSPVPSGLPQFLYVPASELPLPPTKVAHGPIVLDALNMLWVADYSYPGHPPTAWSVFDTTGVWLGELESPSGFELFEVGPDYLLGTFTDDLEVEHVRLYRLQRDFSGED